MTLAAIDHDLEQECLFYVAASRARDRLLLYSATRTASSGTGSPRRRDPSPFIARLGVRATRAATPRTDRTADPEDKPLPVRIGPPIRITTSQLHLYSRCRRRYLYTHVLGVGGKRTSTTITSMHDIVRSVIEDMTGRQPTAGSASEAVTLLDRLWSEGPLAGDEYAIHREIAGLLVQRFVDLRAGGTLADPVTLETRIGDDTLIAIPDDLITNSSGQRIARMVRTGHRSSRTGEDVADAAFQIAAAASLPGCTAEIIHLGDDDPTTRVTFDHKGLGKQTEKLSKAFTAIGEGRFEADRSDRTCPFCPAFFTCGPIVDGSLQKNS